MSPTTKAQPNRTRPLNCPETLLQQQPLAPKAAQFISSARQSINSILSGDDPRLLVIVGPCSIHDENAALEYAQRLAYSAKQLAEDLLIVMRVYFEKPRTQSGWKGILRDPYLDNSFDSNTGLSLARKILLRITDLQLPAATEFLDISTPNYLQDLISWAAIGARTTESQIHRELASGLPMPVGFKNTTDGNIQTAIDAIHVAASAQHYFGMSPEGSPAIIDTSGNPHCHLVLRGSRVTTNYDSVAVLDAERLLAQAQLPSRLLIDCNHGNSQKNYLRQLAVINELAQQIGLKRNSIFGVMIESHLIAGKQSLSQRPLTYGQSITDSCIGWDETSEALTLLAKSQRKRRNLNNF